MTHPKRTHIHESVKVRANSRRHECPSGKAAYDTKATARSEAARISKAMRNDSRPLTFYKCRDCDRFHLTSKEQW